MKSLHALALLGCSLLFTGCASQAPKNDSINPAPAPGKRSLGEFVDDQKLESSVYSNINNSTLDFTETHIRAHSFKGILLLTGQVPDEDLKQEAGRAATEVAGVRRVHNEIELKSNSNFFSRSNDNGLEAKIRVKLLASRDIEGAKVRVVVEDRVVYIMGLLTRKEAKIATQIVSSTSGIERVVRVVEFLD